MAGLIGPVSGSLEIQRVENHISVFEQDAPIRPTRPTVGFVVPEVATAAVSSGVAGAGRYSVAGLGEVVKGYLVDFYT